MKRFGTIIQGLMLLACWLIAGSPARAQIGNSGTISGTVLDPSGGAVPNATVTIHNPVSQYERSTTTDRLGSFTFTNVPFNPYHLSVSINGFAPYAQDVDVASSVPLTIKVSLKVAGANTTITVESGGDLIENDPTDHTDIDKAIVDKLPLESPSSSLSSLVTLSSPGIAADSNGLFHGLGDHAENSFSIDGQPVTDQQSKVFSNQLPVDAVQSLEVIDGAPPAEYGDKTSVVIVATTRSGQGVTTPHGTVSADYGTFGTTNGAFDLAYGGQSWGNFVSASGLDTGRFLDPPEFTVMHDKGNEENLFDRLDYQFSTANSVHLNLQYTRSWFQTPNSFDATYASAWNGLVGSGGEPVDSSNNCVIAACTQPVGITDQRSQIRTFNVAPVWTHLLGQSAVFTLGAFVRRDQYNYYPSNDPFADLAPAGLQSQTVSQLRFLTNAGIRSEVSYVKGIHNIKAGVTYEQTFLREHDNIAIVDPTFAASLGCLDALGNPEPNTACAYDLTNGGGYYGFRGRTDVKQLAMYVEDSITAGSWNFNVGIRGDLYNGLSIDRQAEPRLGVAYNVKQTNTVLRVSYARTLETPFNENLVLSSIGCSDPILNPLLACAPGGLAFTPLRPGYRNEFHAGLQQAFGKHVVLDGEYIWKYTHNGYDFSILGTTPVTFPVEWNNSKIPGFALRTTVTDFHGFTAYVVMSSVAARFFTPQLGGAGAVPAAVGPFRIDHDEKFNQTTHLQYQPWKLGPWFGFNWRYDSGLVAGPVPCAGGNCANGITSDTIVDVSGISPDQQFQAGLFCGSVHATPPSASNPTGTPISPTNQCAATQYGSSLISIPAPGTEDDDHNPPRISPRNLFDLAVGDDNLFRGRSDRYKWSVQVTVINLANRLALYNFLSTFSGTHYVTPRTFTGQIAFHF
ncbi:MAG TPA: carboxypeptidase regulatory-like domain-containing protein [Candidatus Acidoferrum sp.]|nr:carboxypeptidase regulatory-like domain-containing protein [Candidatus Acidoferrum sp.]